MSSKTRTIPFDQDVEEIILISMLATNVERKQIKAAVDWSDFFLSEHQNLYRAMVAVSGEFTLDKLYHEIKGRGLDKTVIQRVYAMSSVKKDYDVPHYIQHLKILSNRRKAIKNCQKLTDIAFDSPDDFEQASQDMRKVLVECMQYDEKRPIHIKEILHEFKDGLTFFEKLKRDDELRAQGLKVIDGLETGFNEIDKTMAGFQNGHNIIIGARPGNGKTTFLCTIILNLMDRYPDRPILFFSLEMSRERIFEKLICMKACIPHRKIKESLSERDVQTLEEAGKMIESAQLYVYDNPGTSIDVLESISIQQQEVTGLGIVLIDYLTIVGKPFGSRAQARHEQVGEISKGLYRMSRLLKVPVVTLAQLSRNVANRTDKRPLMSDLKESGQIEEDADSILLMHRPALYDESNREIKDNTLLYCEKNRELGERFRISLEFREGRLMQEKSLEEFKFEQRFNDACRYNPE